MNEPQQRPGLVKSCSAVRAVYTVAAIGMPAADEPIGRFRLEELRQQ